LANRHIQQEWRNRQQLLSRLAKPTVRDSGMARAGNGYSWNLEMPLDRVLLAICGSPLSGLLLIFFNPSLLGIPAAAVELLNGAGLPERFLCTFGRRGAEREGSVMDQRTGLLRWLRVPSSRCGGPWPVRGQAIGLGVFAVVRSFLAHIRFQSPQLRP
jgi:hypothetical protein